MKQRGPLSLPILPPNTLPVNLDQKRFLDCLLYKVLSLEFHLSYLPLVQTLFFIVWYSYFSVKLVITRLPVRSNVKLLFPDFLWVPSVIQKCVYFIRGAHQKNIRSLSIVNDIHRKKRFTSFPSLAGMSLTKLPLGRNNSVMTSLFPPMENLLVTSRLGPGNSRIFFYGVHVF